MNPRLAVNITIDILVDPDNFPKSKFTGDIRNQIHYLTAQFLREQLDANIAGLTVKVEK